MHTCEKCLSQEAKFHNIFQFWVDDCPFWKQVGSMFFFELCWWHGR